MIRAFISRKALRTHDDCVSNYESGFIGLKFRSR